MRDGSNRIDDSKAEPVRLDLQVEERVDVWRGKRLVVGLFRAEGEPAGVYARGSIPVEPEPFLRGEELGPELPLDRPIRLDVDTEPPQTGRGR